MASESAARLSPPVAIAREHDVAARVVRYVATHEGAAIYRGAFAETFDAPDLPDMIVAYLEERRRRLAYPPLRAI